MTNFFNHFEEVRLNLSHASFCFVFVNFLRSHLGLVIGIFLFIAVKGFSQEVLDKEKFNKEFVEMVFQKVNSYHSNGTEKIDWIFEFAHRDSSTLSTILNYYVDSHQNVSLDTISIGTVSDNKWSGFYLADLIDSNHYDKNDLLEKMKNFRRIFKRSELMLSGVGFLLRKDTLGSLDSTESLYQHVSQLYTEPPPLNSKNDFLIEGEVIDMASKVPIPYVNIGIENSNIGTVSDENGRFEIVIPRGYKQDSISFSCVGYKKEKRVIHSALDTESTNVQMEQSAFLLDEVVIESKRFNRKKVLGITKVGNQFGFVQGTGAGAEAARLLDSRKKIVYLNNAAIYVWNEKKSPFKFMVNVYEQDSLTGLPGKNLMKNPLVVESSISKGWLEVNLNSQNLVVEKPFFISFQWLDENLRHPLIALKGSKAFVRPTSFGSWIETKNFSWAIKVDVTIID